MTSWYSNIVTKTTSQISSLRSTILSSEADGDTEDDTHVCRVLRNYYSDKGRPRPGWLPADPKAAAQAPQPMYAQPQVGSRYGGLSSPHGSGTGGGGLSSLWDNGPSQQAPPPQHPQSLRAGRPPPNGGMLSPGMRDDPSARPMAGSRTGSYQSVHSSSGASSAQDRLKQRLYGGTRTTSPGPGNQSPSAGGGQYGGGGGGGGGGGANNSQWGNGGDPYGGNGGRSNQMNGQQQRQGLPNGPRGYR